MDTTISISRTTLSPGQMRRTLLELSEKLRHLADMQMQQEMKDVKSVESVPEFRDLIHDLCQEAPLIAQAIAAAIREKIPEPSPRLSAKRKWAHDPSYRPSQLVSKRKRTDDRDVVYEATTSKSPGSEHGSPEPEGAPGSVSCIGTVDLGTASKRESKTDSMALTIGGDNRRTTEEVDRETVQSSADEVRREVSLESEDLISDVFLDTVYDMIDTVHLLHKHPDNLPRTVHQGVLQSLHANQGINVTVHQWSDGKTWMEVLEKGSATKHRCTVLNMLEYMGASKWYDDQIEVAKHTVLTKGNKAVGEKGAATHVLNRITEHSVLSRKVISNQLSRGKRLRVLVEAINLGILMSPNIWSYTKIAESQFNRLLQELKADTQRMALFQIFTPQVEHLVESGSTDPEALYNSLRQSNLASEDELQRVKAKYALERNSLPEGALMTTYNQLISRVSNLVFKKQKVTDRDTLIINHSLKRPAECLFSLEPGRWLDCWVIQIAMHIADRPNSVHFRESIPVNAGRTRLIPRPFKPWVEEITELRKKAQTSPQGHGPLTFYSPVHHTDSHFTLLEICDRERVIRHYDSLAETTTISRKKKTRIATLVEEEFGYFGYKYFEVPTPQQSDNWSCGDRVVWAFRQRCNRLEINSWNTVLDSERLRFDIVKSLMACIDSNSMQKYSRSSESCVRSNADGHGEGRLKQNHPLICVD